jgi:4-phytase/acid phosphatase/peptide/nickel transport system substrate-binding protein
MVTVMVAALVLLAGSGAGWCAPAAKPRSGGVLTIGVEEDCKGFDPIKAGILTTSARSAALAVEERLFDMDAKGRLVPELGLTATPAKDGRSWTVTLRRGVLFQDGTAFNADAVVSHWERLLDPKNRFRGISSIEPVAKVEKVDDFTVRFRLKHPWLPFKDAIASTTAIAAYIPSPKAVKEGTQDRAPVGTGPYRFNEWLPGDRMTVVKNPAYWQKGKPNLESIVFRIVPDMQTRFAGLKSGELDVILTDRGASVLQAKEDKSLRVYSSESTGAETFIFNTSRSPLNDVRVRRAIAHAWNQEFYIRASYKGTIPVAHDPFGGTLTCGDPGYREYNLDKARKLLADYGKPVSLEVQVTNTPRGREFGEMVQRMLKEVGVTVTITPLALSQRNKLVFAGDYQMTGWTLFDNTDMGPTLYANLFSTSAMNFSQYRNPAMDRLLTTVQTSASGKERQKALCGVARQINDEAVLLYRGGLRYNAIAKAEVKGISRVDNAIVRVKDVWWEKSGK